MRHGKKFNHLSRTAAHRSAMLSNMASSLIQHKRITTTVAKAKALRKYVEPLITKAKSDTTHSRRVVFSYLQDKSTVTTLFNEVVDKIGSRPGGYTRIIKTNNRLGDNADMCIIELVDYNELLLEEAKPEKKSTRRSRRGGKKSSTTATKPTAETTAAVAEAEVVEDTTDEEVEDVSSGSVEEEVKAEATDDAKEAKEETPDAEEKSNDAEETEKK